MKAINLLTKNNGKIQAARSVFSKYGIEIKQLDFDSPEIQGENSLDIAKYTALNVAKDLNKPVIREDHSFYINAIKSPGPYMSFFEKRIPVASILKILENFEDRTGYFEIATVYAEPNGHTLEYTFQVPVVLEKEEAIKNAQGWSGIMRLTSETQTLAEGTEEERFEIFGQNYKKIAEYLTQYQRKIA